MMSDFTSSATGFQKLYSVNLGSYDPKDFADQHRSVFVVITAASDTKTRELGTITSLKDGYRDDLYDVESGVRARHAKR